MKHRLIWHDRPVLAPLVYGTSAMSVGAPAYVSGYLLTEHIRYGIYALIFMDLLLVLFLLECRRSAGKRRRQK